MRRIGSTPTLTGVVVLLLAAGCQQQRIDINRLVQRAERPPELARLDVLIGDWSGEAKLTMTGSHEVVTNKCTTSYSWDADQWILIEHFEHGEGDKRVASVAFWSWDHRDKLYRITRFYNSGARADGTASYTEMARTGFMTTKTNRPDTDEETRDAAGIWFMTAKTNNPYTNVKTRRTGGMTLVDENTLQLWWTEWLPGPFGAFLSESNIGSFESVIRRR